jgi:hypothetical protein|tara:strand:+ start:214 stop:393 length:180 start_codon:yes stop_codon:yes gene_type:complete
MSKIKDFLLTCIKITSGTILLLIVILFWAIALVLTTLSELITWVEIKLTKLMKKCYGEL